MVTVTSEAESRDGDGIWQAKPHLGCLHGRFMVEQLDMDPSRAIFPFLAGLTFCGRNLI